MQPQTKKTLLKLLVAGLAAGFLLRCFVMDILIVNGKSMEPSIHDREVIFINRLAYGLAVPFGSSLFMSWNEPENNDCVIYMYDNNLVVKRCAAVQGELLEYSADNGYNLIVGNRSYPLTWSQYQLMGRIKQVPRGMILAIGDNAEVSLDSRSYGFVPVKNIIGKVICK